jgi:hypothetical protein
MCNFVGEARYNLFLEVENGQAYHEGDKKKTRP